MVVRLEGDLKTRFVLVVTGFLFLASLAVAGEVYDERAVVTFDERNWTAAFANANREMFLVEYKLPGEELTDWSELVTSNTIPVVPDDGALQFLHDYHKENILKRCSEAYWEEKYSDPDMVIVAWNTEPCPRPDGTEYTLTCFMNGVRNLHVIHYATKSKRVFEETVDAWENRLKKTLIFTPKYSSFDEERPVLSDTSKMLSVTYRWILSPEGEATELSPPRQCIRVGEDHVRYEEFPNFDNQLSYSIIWNETNYWELELLSKRGVRSWPDKKKCAELVQVFGENRGDGLQQLSFGKEKAFFMHYGARKIPPETIGGVECIVFELPRLYWVLRLYLRADSDTPYIASRRGPDGVVQRVLFEAYERTSRVDESIFLPPTDFELE